MGGGGGGQQLGQTPTRGTQVDMSIFAKNFQIVGSGQLAFGDRRLWETAAGHLRRPEKDLEKPPPNPNKGGCQNNTGSR